MLLQGLLTPRPRSLRLTPVISGLPVPAPFSVLSVCARSARRPRSVALPYARNVKTPVPRNEKASPSPARKGHSRSAGRGFRSCSNALCSNWRTRSADTPRSLASCSRVIPSKYRHRISFANAGESRSISSSSICRSCRSHSRPKISSNASSAVASGIVSALSAPSSSSAVSSRLTDRLSGSPRWRSLW